MTLSLGVASFIITLIEQVRSTFNKLSVSQLKGSEWTKAVIWTIWFLYIAILALVKRAKWQNDAKDSYRAWEVVYQNRTRVQVWPDEDYYPSVSNVLGAFIMAFPFWYSLPIMWRQLKMGTFETDQTQMEPSDNVLPTNDGGSGDLGLTNDGGSDDQSNFFARDQSDVSWYGPDIVENEPTHRPHEVAAGESTMSSGVWSAVESLRSAHGTAT
ncbi:uncharacterized protein RHO25_008733 [Cercospora beticola]|uniref:Uncharacterized protein n=1 Tax=Cercospora beticola TaxID=122368 RepID=A0ABZ0NWY5_CERBT|nr:hypothetical protein RHO25_008733 [Cercospora beticola]